MTFKKLMLSDGLLEISVDGKSGHLKWSEILRICSMMVQVPWWFRFHDGLCSMMILHIYPSDQCDGVKSVNIGWICLHENSCLKNRPRVWRLHSPNCLRSSCLACVFRKQTSLLTFQPRTLTNRNTGYSACMWFYVIVCIYTKRCITTMSITSYEPCFFAVSGLYTSFCLRFAYVLPTLLQCPPTPGSCVLICLRAPTLTT